MKKNFFIFFICLLTACGSGADEIAATDSAFKTEVPKELLVDAEQYVGTLPCADCEGINVSLQLYKNNKRYIMVSQYKGNRVDSSNNAFKDSGTWSLHGVDTLYLTSEENSVKYIKTDTALIQLDGDGNRITGPLADNFVLHRK